MKLWDVLRGLDEFLENLGGFRGVLGCSWVFWVEFCGVLGGIGRVLGCYGVFRGVFRCTPQTICNKGSFIFLKN